MVKQTKTYGSKISHLLRLLKADVDDSVKTFPKEPETHVKRTVHRTLAHQFDKVVRNSHMLQSEFMNSLNSRVKTDLRVVNPNFTEEELYEMKEDPEAALKLQMSNVLGPAHPRLK